ncbi:anti-sigma regulatory factor (Ser/Thr protein kinase) [Catenuloplanes nepalensis]|uniref:Anti-sigma regulatory factor (Ser/Thr protein kinase) n=1 Tax=Catenuloplanes nepalensis TaxID=587533 RepID=A0ABT9N4E8_9ACTN|nr:ATP-binding protein [Catenuloplanes nepalensis]MDP9798583.1 anti-sigma regulatory factor (Ser/Thr protein kinase) [Catenuloplanes nepalensis]
MTAVQQENGSVRSRSLEVPHHAQGVRAARRQLTRELTGSIAASLLCDVVTVVAELLSNAIRHARPLPGGVIRLSWRLRRTAGDARVLEVRVTDGGAATGPRMRPAGPRSIDGRGLGIVAAMARCWGTDRDASGHSVWAEFSLA